jgi:hypothetical protein
VLGQDYVIRAEQGQGSWEQGGRGKPDSTVCAVQHLDWSPLEYIRWRYEIGEDREGLDKVDRAVRLLLWSCG